MSERCCENGFFGQTHDCRKGEPARPSEAKIDEAFQRVKEKHMGLLEKLAADEAKPREWWIKQVGHWPGKDEIYDAHNSIPPGCVHVIEHAAYQALEREREHYKREFFKATEAEDKLTRDVAAARVSRDEARAECERLRAALERIAAAEPADYFHASGRRCNVAEIAREALKGES